MSAHRAASGPKRETVPLLERVAARIQHDGEHMIWTGTFSNGSGYVFVERGHRPFSVQRVLWEELHGPTKGRIQRQCSEDRCVNPAHFALKRKMSLTPDSVPNEAALLAHWEPQAERAAGRVYRSAGVHTTSFALEDVVGEAQLQLLIAIRTDERLRNPHTDGGYVFWLIRKRLLDWLTDQTRSNKAWSLLRANSLNEKSEGSNYEVRDIHYAHPDLAALDSAFLDAFESALAALTADELDVLSVGIERSGEKLREAALRLGIGYQQVRKQRASIEAKLMGLLQARGWFTGPDVPNVS